MQEENNLSELQSTFLSPVILRSPNRRTDASMVDAFVKRGSTLARNRREQVSNAWKDLPGFLRELQSTGGCADAATAAAGLPPEAASLTAFREPANQSTNLSSAVFFWLLFFFSYFSTANLASLSRVVPSKPDTKAEAKRQKAVSGVTTVVKSFTYVCLGYQTHDRWSIRRICNGLRFFSSRQSYN